jgi:outer membrane autotransporter protein
VLVLLCCVRASIFTRFRKVSWAAAVLAGLVGMISTAVGALPAMAATNVCPPGPTTPPDNVNGTLLGSQNVTGGVSNSDAARLAFVQQLVGVDKVVVQVACSFTPSNGLSGTYTQTAPGTGVITHILVKASTLQQVYAVPSPPVSSGTWSTQCIRNNGGQQPGISGVFCYQVGSQQGQGTINITKKVVGGTGTFSFKLDNPSPASDDDFSLTPPIAIGESTQGFIKPAGTYTIAENAPPPDFTLTSLTCTRDGVAFTDGISGSSAQFALGADETINCTYTNTKDVAENGTIKIVKIATGGDDAFNFTIDPGGLDQEIITSGGNGETIPVNLTPGTYSVSELLPAGWTPTDADCVSEDGPQGSPDTTSVTGINLEADENVVCTFKNKLEPGQATLTLKKIVINDDGRKATPADFTLSFSGPGGSGSGAQGSAAVTGVVVTPGNYTLTEDGPSGYDLTALTCDGFDPDGSDGLLILNGEDVTCTFKNNDKADTRTEEEVKRFVHRRVDNLLTYGPDRARMLRRLRQGRPQPSLKDEPLKLGHAEMTGSGALGEAGGETVRAERTAGSSVLMNNLASGLMPLATGQSSLRFGTSLSEIKAAVAMSEEHDMRAKMEAAGLGYLGQSYSNPYVELRPGFDVWIEGQIAEYKDTLGGIDREGDFSILYLGADYVISPGFLVGALVQLDRTEEDIDDPSLVGEIDGTGWMAGPYLGVRLLDNLYFDARAAWGRSSNDFTLDDTIVGARSGSFDTDRWLVSASLTGTHYYNMWRFSPQVSLAYGTETYDDFATSLGQTITGDGAHIGRLTGTMEIGRSFYGRDGTIIEPHVAVSGIWNFDSDDLVINGQLVETEGGRAKVEGGVLVTMPNGISLRGAASVDGLGDDDLEAVSGSAWLSIPLN